MATLAAGCRKGFTDPRVIGSFAATVRIDFATTQKHSPEYLKINPKARVPALVTDRGVLTETPAMLALIAQSFPAALSRLSTILLPLPRYRLSIPISARRCMWAHAHRMRGYRWVDANDKAALSAMQRMVPQSVTACFELIERDMLKGPWVMGERYTISGPYLFNLAQWLEAAASIPRAIRV